MTGTEDILEIAKMTINASIKCNTIRGYIGWHSCDNICMDMHDVLDMCEDAFTDVYEVCVWSVCYENGK